MRYFIFLSVILVGFFPITVTADLFSYGKKNKNYSAQTKILDTRVRTQFRASGRLQPESLLGTNTAIIPRYSGSYRGPFLNIAREAATRHGIPLDLFLRLIQQESNWNPNAISHKGAIGLAQLMPETAKYLAVNAKDPYQNLEGGAKYLAEQYREFGSWKLALAAYNAGPKAVEKYNGIPPYNETKNYVKSILGSYNELILNKSVQSF
ncbi:MAG: lytic transglycosylase domain-containing protein [Aestuariivita sp.]|nr:lytic transglycosylase domain-containing protein [Aestuariivita sp.]